MAESVAAWPAPLSPQAHQAPAWLKAHVAFVLAGGMLAGILLVALLGPALAPHDPDAVDALAAMRPVGSPGHPLGTDYVGRDVLSRLLVGVRTSVFFGVWPAAAVLALSTGLGVVCAYVGGLLDSLIMRTLDVFLAFPFFILAVALVTYLGPSLRNAMIALIVVSIPGNVRVIRSVVLSLRERPYIEAARVLGYGQGRIIFGEILPGVLPNAIMLFTLSASHMIAAGSALSFLGLGAQPPTADLGNMIAEARFHIRTQPSLILLPVAVLTVITYAFFAFGDAVQNAIGPSRTSG
jgi:ABC-type dipeptide/oligopeptide/nickel transport system permease subunit